MKVAGAIPLLQSGIGELARRVDIQQVRVRDVAIEAAELQGAMTARLGKLESIVLAGRPPVPPENAVYDAQTVAVMRRCLRRDSNGIDVGCHEGKFLDDLLAIAPEGTHFAFEPLPPCFRRLQDRFAQHPTVRLYEVALSDTHGESTFQYVLNSPAYSGLRRRRYDVPDARIDEIRVQTDLLR